MCYTLNPEQIEMEIFEDVEIWHNKIRRHSALKNMTIDEFWNLNKKALNSLCKKKLGTPPLNDCQI